jgi:hypothetical protein
MNGAFVEENGLDVLAIAEPVEVGTPEVTTALSHRPATSAGFAEEGV